MGNRRLGNVMETIFIAKLFERIVLTENPRTNACDEEEKKGQKARTQLRKLARRWLCRTFKSFGKSRELYSLSKERAVALHLFLLPRLFTFALCLPPLSCRW